MTNNAQEHLNQIVRKERIAYLDISNRDLAGNMDLGEFANLKSVNSSNNKFTNLDFLLTLPDKNKLESINFFGNEIETVDFATLFANFPNLKTINLDNNPLSLKNLDRLSAEQMTFLVEAVANKKIKISSWKGTIILDLLTTIQQLKEQLAGTGTTHRREIPIQQNNQGLSEKPSNNFGLIIPVIGGSLLIGSLFTFIYLKSKKKPAKYE